MFSWSWWYGAHRFFGTRRDYIEIGLIEVKQNIWCRRTPLTLTQNHRSAIPAMKGDFCLSNGSEGCCYCSVVCHLSEWKLGDVWAPSALVLILCVGNRLLMLTGPSLHPRMALVTLHSFYSTVSCSNLHSSLCLFLTPQCFSNHVSLFELLSLLQRVYNPRDYYCFHISVYIFILTELFISHSFIKLNHFLSL